MEQQFFFFFRHHEETIPVPDESLQDVMFPTSYKQLGGQFWQNTHKTNVLSDNHQLLQRPANCPSIEIRCAEVGKQVKHAGICASGRRIEKLCSSET